MGKKTTKTSSTSTIPAWAQGLATSGGNDILNTVEGNAGNLQNITGQISGYLPQLGQAAFGQNPTLGAANSYAQNVMGGQYLNSNPYVQQMAQFAGQQAGNAVNSSFSQAGRTGSGNNVTDLARGVSQGELQPLMQNYQNERGLQNQAAGMTPGLTAAQFSGVPAYLSAANTAGTLPYAGLGALSGMGNLWAGQGTQTGTQPGGWGNGLVSAAASALPFILCERSSKTKIELLHREADGLGWYRFAYKSAPNILLEGPMADEVEALRPWALGPKLPDGRRTVNMAEIRRAA